MRRFKNDKPKLSLIEQELRDLADLRGMRCPDNQIRLINRETGKFNIVLKEMQDFCGMAKAKEELPRKPLHLQIIDFTLGVRRKSGGSKQSPCPHDICCGSGYLELKNRETGERVYAKWCSCKVGTSQFEIMLKSFEMTPEHYAYVEGEKLSRGGWVEPKKAAIPERGASEMTPFVDAVPVAFEQDVEVPR